ncbi:MAG: HlyD family efflux transporter periplasmic adaptor subunit [Magnetococcales bacterium]|nr:HlyD family efflux transporter periplasmic adaptor subunit [Magnetococcales bacterium]
MPPLRSDVRVYPGPVSDDGAPTWTLWDPLRQKFFQLGWMEHTIVSCWSAGDVAAVTRAARRLTAGTVTPAHVETVSRFLIANELTQAREPSALRRLQAKAAARRESPLVWLFHRYLYLKIPLWRPDRWLERHLPLARWFASRFFLGFLLIAGGLGIHLSVRQWDRFLHALPDHPTPAAALILVVTVWVSKALHELAHAFVARHYGCRVPAMGVAWIVLWPVLYAETSEVWKLTSRPARLWVGAAGVGAELALALLATLAWHFVVPGPLQQALVLLASVTWLTTLAVNLNPCMRFDGYYLLSDALGIPNLAARAFALASWQWREWLCAPGDPPPEPWPWRRQVVLLVYAHVTWAYRLVVFLGIALLVYHAFFKLAGIVLMTAEIGWFLVRPVVGFFRAIPLARARKGRLAVTVSVMIGGLGAMACPWQQSVELPALLVAREQTRLFAPEPGRIREVFAHPGDTVTQGAPLMLLDSPELDQAAAAADSRLTLLQLEIAQSAARPAVLAMRYPLEGRLVEARAAKRGAEARRARLRIVAPFAGRVTMLGEGVAPGRWVARNTPLAELIVPGQPVVEAWVPERELSRLIPDSPGRFHPARGVADPVDVRLTAVDRGAVTVLTRPHLASTHGGPIPVRPDPAGRPVPDDSWYAATLTPVSDTASVAVSPAASAVASLTNLPGTVLLSVRPGSFLEPLWQSAVAVWIRESGF